jgi:small GTP-binding protein
MNQHTIKEQFHTASEQFKAASDRLLPDVDQKDTFFAFLKMPGAIIIAIICIVLSLLFVFRQQVFKFIPIAALRRRAGGKKTILICGPKDSGKTLLFYTLLNGKFQPTQTSLEENVDTFNLHSGVFKDYTKDKAKLTSTRFEFIDCPGQSSQELKMFKFVPRAQGVVVLVDSSSQESCINGAKILYSLLENKKFADRQIPVLVCANKSDLTDVQSMPAIREKFLKELNHLRESRTTMESIETNEEATVPVGKSGEVLGWESFTSPISFGQISVKDGHLRDVLDFLEALPQ